MIKIEFRSTPVNGNERFYCYRVAEKDVVVNFPVDMLCEYEQDCSTLPTVGPECEIRMDGAQRLYQGPGWIGNRWREVNCCSVSSGYRISVAGIGVFWVSALGERIICTEAEPASGLDLVAEAILGPALIMALAVQGVWCLHASTVIHKGRTIAFMGESGKGKSTLARWLKSQEGGSWRRVGDDILPICLTADGVDVLPHFPQLKLAVEEQPARGFVERLSLDAVYVVRRPGADEGVGLRPLGRQEGALALIRHTVASRLFDDDLLARQLDFCVQTAAAIPVCELIYPLTPGALPLVQEALLQDIQSREVSTEVLATKIS